MNIKNLSRVTITGLVASLISLPLLSPSSKAEIVVVQSRNDLPNDRVTFYCGAMIHREEGRASRKIPATVAYVPQRRANIPIVGWNQKLVGWSTQARCDAVSPKFQTFYEDGRLNYLTNGESNGYPIICALLDKQETCSGENQLFQIRPGSKPEDVISGLKDILDGKNSRPIYQSSGDRFYIKISEFLKEAPAIEVETSTLN